MVKEKRQGQVIVAAVFVLVIVALLGIVAVSILSTESFSVVKNLQGIPALNVAEGGIQFTVATSLAADTDFSNNADFGPVSLNPGTFSVHYITRFRTTCWLEVTGTVSGVSRVVRARVRKGNLPSQFTDFSAYAGDPGSVGGTLTFHAASRIIGSFYYYGPIVMVNSSFPVQTGGLIDSTSIIPAPTSGIPKYYEAWEQIGTAEPVAWNNTYYDNWLNVAANPPAPPLGNPNYNNGTLNLSGQTIWYTAFTARGSTVITGPGTICATTGLITISDTTRFAGGMVRLIGLNSPNSINLNDNTSWATTAEVIALDQLNINNSVTTPANSILYSKSSTGGRGVTVTSKAIARGSVLAPYGTVTINLNGWIRGLIYAYSLQAQGSSTQEGGGVFRGLADFLNNSMTIQNPDVLPSVLPPGVSPESTSTASFEIYSWREAY